MAYFALWLGGYESNFLLASLEDVLGNKSTTLGAGKSPSAPLQASGYDFVNELKMIWWVLVDTWM